MCEDRIFFSFCHYTHSVACWLLGPPQRTTMYPNCLYSNLVVESPQIISFDGSWYIICLFLKASWITVFW